MSSVPPSEQQKVSGKEVLSICSAIALMIAIMVASYYYPYPSGKRPELLSLLMLWGREALALAFFLILFVVGFVVVVVKAIIDAARSRSTSRLGQTLSAKNRTTFHQPTDLWESDGSLRDVYIQDVTLADWTALLTLAAEHPHKHSFGGQECPLPDIETIFKDSGHAHLLRVFVGEVAINCDFFIPTEIELDIDPRHVQTAEDHLNVLAFLEQLSTATMKNLAVTAESSPENPYLSFDPKSMQWEVHEPRFRAQ
jgi:hypothetical protein